MYKMGHFYNFIIWYGFHGFYTKAQNLWNLYKCVQNNENSLFSCFWTCPYIAGNEIQLFFSEKQVK